MARISTGQTLATAEFQPADDGLITWAYDPAVANNSTAMPTGGVLNLVKVHIPYATTITNIVMGLTNVGVTLTAGQCFAALFTTAGTWVRSTADLAATWAGVAGTKTTALTTPYVASAGDHYVGFWYNGTTGPTFARSSGVQAGLYNIGLSTPNLRFSTADTGLTTTAPGTFGAQTASATTYWVGLS